MKDSKFTVVIPTMWRYAPFVNFLTDLVKFPLIDEIIIINNDVEKTPNAPVLSHEKVRMINFKENIYVNPAWNIGVRESRNKNIGILSDDVIFDIKAFYHVQEVLSPTCGVVGICLGDPNHNQPPFQTGSIKIKPWEGEHTMGFGCLMFVHKDTWIDIPDCLKVYYGDNWVFDTALWEGRTNYLITDILYHTPHAQTSGTIVNNFLDKETEFYKPELEKWKGILFNVHSLKIEYENACRSPSNINEHLPVLKFYGDQVTHITEFGVSDGCSTRAFLNTDATLRSYDIVHNSQAQAVFDIAKSREKNVQYIIADVTKIEIEPTDLLFIDSWHSYFQLKKELELHSSKVKKYIMFHDTHTFGTKDEGGQTHIGLLPAIIEFTIDNPQWKFALHKTNNNGLTVLEKCEIK
jgi:hypothetical protein